MEYNKMKDEEHVYRGQALPHSHARIPTIFFLLKKTPEIDKLFIFVKLFFFFFNLVKNTKPVFLFLDSMLPTNVYLHLCLNILIYEYFRVK